MYLGFGPEVASDMPKSPAILAETHSLSAVPESAVNRYIRDYILYKLCSRALGPPILAVWFDLSERFLTSLLSVVLSGFESVLDITLRPLRLGKHLFIGGQYSRV